jgi:murein DD-endopeptidase MepM/ murein hydrolase activator NlpD
MMTNFALTTNVSISGKFLSLFKPRDIFLHDGKSLRRFTIGAKLQMAAAVLLTALLAWSAFASVQAWQAMNGDVAQMERQVAEMQADVEAIRREATEKAAVLEQRQAFLAAMLSGEASADELARLIPPAVEGGATEVSQQFESVDGMQTMLARQATEATRQRYQETAQLFRSLGLNPNRFARSQRGVGGPFEAVRPLQNADPQFRELFASWRQLEQLEQGAIAIPSAMPVSNANFTSGFGVRSDPFRGRAAMHAGIDLAGPTGTPIYATADGIVNRSEYAGAYGNLVEINHGQGIQTRYGHLSRLIAQPGQRVKRGELIGLMGSTGRSTGPHLHYEVRIDGRAVNPLPFLQSSETLIALQQRARSGSPVALGGPEAGAR